MMTGDEGEPMSSLTCPEAFSIARRISETFKKH